MTVKIITDATYEKETANNVTITDFWAEWCPPCKMQSPVLDALSEKMNNVSFNKIDVDSNKEIPTKLGIMSIPTLIIKKDGEIKERLVGYTPLESLENILKKYVD